MVLITNGYAQVFQNHGFYNITELSSEDINTKCVLFKYSWTIQLKSSLLMMPKEMISPEFPNRAESGITWYLTATWRGQGRIIGVKLSLTSCNVQNVNANYRFSLRNSRGTIIMNWLNAPNKLFKLNDPLEMSDVIPLCPKTMPTDSVTIDCEITLSAFQVYRAKYQNILENHRNLTFQFTEELLTMFENEEFSDVTFSVNGRELKAHKVILAAGSSVFKVMFEHDMMEKKHNRVEIKDINFEVLRELIRFMYTKEVFNLDKIAKELLVASDKYNLEKLKNMCENVLCKNVSIENVAEIFVFADTYNVGFLKAKAKNFIVRNSKNVSGTSGWKSMILTHPHLTAEAFIALSNK